MSVSRNHGETSPIFDGLTPGLPTDSRKNRRARLAVAAAGALPIIAAATASWVAGAATLPDVDPTKQQPVPPEPTSDDLVGATSVLGHVTHTVLEGESLTSIAEMHGIPTAALLALNGLSWQTTL
ncbi:MAG: hypothetical protein RLZZ319_843, partial [Actinomycetota bacterium]